jgi:hypothetical protein
MGKEKTSYIPLNESSSGMNDLEIIFLIIGILLIVLAFFLPAKQKLEN